MGKLGQPVNSKSSQRPQKPSSPKQSFVITAAALPYILIRPHVCHGTTVLNCCSLHSSNFYRIITHNFISFQICHRQLWYPLFTDSTVAQSYSQLHGPLCWLVCSCWSRRMHLRWCRMAYAAIDCTPARCKCPWNQKMWQTCCAELTFQFTLTTYLPSRLAKETRL